MIGSGFHPHVWYAGSGDIFRRNIVSFEYRPARMSAPPWGQEMDRNIFHQSGAAPSPAARLQKQSGRDEKSLVADAQFIDPAKGDYRVKEGSPALALGFVNFPMDQFGVRKPALKAIARTPVLPGPQAIAAAPAARDLTPRTWLGASVRNIADEGEMSAFGLPGVTGVLVLEVPAGSALAQAGVQKGDVVLALNGDRVADVAALLRRSAALAAGKGSPLVVSRNQKESTLTLFP